MIDRLREALSRATPAPQDITPFVTRMRLSRNRADCELKSSTTVVQRLKTLRDTTPPFESDMFPREAIRGIEE